MKKTTLCYLEHDDRYLMMLRNKKKNDQSEGKWLGIGGKFLEGESPEACLRREVMEETGFTLDSLHFHGVVHFLSDVWDDEDMYLYTSCNFSWPGSQCAGRHNESEGANSCDMRHTSSNGDEKKPDSRSAQRVARKDDSSNKADAGIRAGEARSKTDVDAREDEASDIAESDHAAKLSSLTCEPPTPECNEGTLSWIPKSQVLGLNLWEGDHLFLERLIKGEDFGELTVRYEGDTLVEVK